MQGQNEAVKKYAKPSRKMHRGVTVADISNAMMSGVKSGDEFYVVMDAYWKFICAEEPALQQWIVREVERLVNQFNGMGVQGAFELLWKLSHGADVALVDAIVSKGLCPHRSDPIHLARVSGQVYR